MRRIDVLDTGAVVGRLTRRRAPGPVLPSAALVAWLSLATSPGTVAAQAGGLPAAPAPDSGAPATTPAAPAPDNGAPATTPAAPAPDSGAPATTPAAPAPDNEPLAPAQEEASEGEVQGPVNFSGRVLEAGTRDPLEEVTISIPRLDLDTYADADGQFYFRGVPPGTHIVKVSLPGYEGLTSQVVITAGKQNITTYYLRPRADKPRALEVRTRREQDEVAQTTIQVEEARRVPGTFGDMIRVVQNLPGVARSPFSLGLLVVRGTGPNDTGFYIDGMRVPIIFHFGGLVSVFNSSLLDRVDFLPGGYSVRYGRTIGGVVDVTTREVIPDRLHGYAEVDLFNSSFYVQGSTKQKLGYSISARRSYIDYLVEPILERTQGLLVQFPRYWDAQLRVDYRPTPKDAVQVMAFASDDRFRFLGTAANADEESLEAVTFGAYITAVRAKGRWTHTFSDTLYNRLDISLGPDIRRTQFGTGGVTFDTPTMYLRDEVAWTQSSALRLRGGIDLLVYRPTFRIELPAFGDESDSGILIEQAALGFSPAPYAEAEWTIGGQLKVTGGLRFDPLVVIDQYQEATLDPRIAFRSQVGDRTVIKGAVGRYSQFPEPQNYFKEIGTPELRAERAIQLSLGFEHDFTDLIHVDVLGYYNRLYDLVVSGPGGGVGAFVEGEATEDNPAFVNEGSGYGYGLEFLLRHDFTEQFFGWVSYTWSRSWRRSSDDNDWRAFSLDQPHVLTVVASYRLPWRIEASARFRLSSGLAYTPVINAFQELEDHDWDPVRGETDSARNEAFHSLDLRVQRDWIFKRWKLQGYLDVQNVYNRANPEASFYSFDFTERQIITGLPILPVLGLRGDF